MRKILVTGASGYIGRAAVKNFLEAGYAVTGICSPSSSSTLKRYTHPKLEWHSFDLLKEYPEHLVEESDGIVHLAAPRSPNSKATTSDSLYRLNVEFTLKILDTIQKYPLKRFIYASTGDVVMRSDREPIESDGPQNIQGFYAATKAVGELLISRHSASKQCCSARIFHPMGLNGDLIGVEFLVNRLFFKIKRGEELCIDGENGIFISPIWVEDLAKDLRLLFESDLTGVAHICGSDILTLKELIEAADRLLKRNTKIKHNSNIAFPYRGSLGVQTKSALSPYKRTSLEDGFAQIASSFEMDQILNYHK